MDAYIKQLTVEKRNGVQVEINWGIKFFEYYKALT